MGGEIERGFRSQRAWFFLDGPPGYPLGIGPGFYLCREVKLLDPKDFARAISQYDLVPDVLLPVVAIGLPIMEILGAVGLVLADSREPESDFWPAPLFCIWVLWYGILNDLDVDCGCFSPEELQAQAGLWQAFYRDLVMIGAAIYLYLSRWLRNGFNQTMPLWAKIKLTL